MLDVTESCMEVPQLDMEVHESPVKEPKQLTNAKEVSTKSLDGPLIRRDQSTKTNRDEKIIIENSKTTSVKENSSIPEYPSDYCEAEAPSEILSSILNQFDKQKEMQKNTGSKDNNDTAVSLGGYDDTESKVHLVSEVPPSFNWLQELEKMASLDEITQIGKAEEKENKTADLEEITLPQSSEEMDSLATLEEGEVIPLDDHSGPAYKKQRFDTSNSDDGKPFNWHQEMNERIKLKGKTYRCVECDFKSPGHMAMIKHLELYHMKNIKGFKCPDCDSVCDTFLIFNEHMKIVHKVKLSILQKNSEEDKLKEKNSFSFLNKSIETASGRPLNWEDEVKKMMRRSSFNKLWCSVCQFRIHGSLKGQKEMLTHIETEHMENLLGFRCNSCDVLFEHFVSFNQHMHIAHNHSLNLLQNGSLFLK